MIKVKDHVKDQGPVTKKDMMRILKRWNGNVSRNTYKGILNEMVTEGEIERKNIGGDPYLTMKGELVGEEV